MMRACQISLMSTNSTDATKKYDINININMIAIEARTFIFK